MMHAHTTLSTTQYKWYCNTISNLKFCNSSANLDNNTAHFMSGHKWETMPHHIGYDVGVVTVPSMVVRSTNTRGHNLNNDSMWVVGGSRTWYVIYGDETGEGIVDGGSHGGQQK
jgi:hypothetical protein